MSDVGQPDRPERMVRFGLFAFDRSTLELLRDDRRVRLTRQSGIVLSRLLERPGQPVSRDQLREALWPDHTFVDFEHGLNEVVNRLRMALGDSASRPRYVETLPRLGYRFIAPVMEPEHTSSQKPSSRRVRRNVTAAAVSGFLVAFGLLGWLREREGSVTESRIGKINALAVLPLSNLSGDPSKDYFVEGMTEELISQLSRLRGLRVIARSSVARFRGPAAPPLAQIADQLGIDAAVEGSVRLDSGRVRITVNLVDARNEESVWSASYQDEMVDVLALQAQVAEAIAGQVAVELTAAERKELFGSEPVNEEAYESYLKGRHYWNQRSADGLKKALECFGRAAASGPSYAPAHAGLADTYALLVVYDVLRPRDGMTKAKASAYKALELDRTLAEAHASLGNIAFLYDWDADTAERELRRAIELKPSYATGHQWYGIFLVSRGRVEEAIDALRLAQKLDPLSLSINENLAWAFYCARRYGEAVEQFQKTLELGPRFEPALRYLGLTYLKMGRAGDALEAFESARRVSASYPENQADLALAYAVAGQQDEALQLISRLLVRSQTEYVSPYLIASFHTGLREKRRALAWLEKAYQERVPNLAFIGVDPFFDELRSESGFENLVARIRLGGQP